MKKIIGVLGVAVISMAMFFNTNTQNSSNGDLDLASLVTMSSANAETPTSSGWLWRVVRMPVTVSHSTGGSIGGYVLESGGEYSWGGTTQTYTVIKDVCLDGWSLCGISHWW